MNRYNFLGQDDVFEALNRLRDAFLTAKDGNEVEEIINGLLSSDEKIKIGRRILVAELLLQSIGIDEISRTLKVGKNTISTVSKNLESHPNCFKLLERRKIKVSKTYNSKRLKSIGASKKVFKKKEYTGFKRKDVER